MTPESRDIISLVTWLKLYTENCDVNKIKSSKVYKLSIFEIYN